MPHLTSLTLASMLFREGCMPYITSLTAARCGGGGGDGGGGGGGGGGGLEFLEYSKNP